MSIRRDDKYEDFTIKTIYPSLDWYSSNDYTINKTKQIYRTDYRCGSWFIAICEYNWEKEKWSEWQELEGYVQNIIEFFIYAWGHIAEMKNYWDCDGTMNEYATVFAAAMKERQKKEN